MSDTAKSVEQPYRVSEMAKLLACSPQHVRTMFRAHRIPGGFQIGRLIRFRRADVDAWLAARVQAGDGTGQSG